MNSVASPQYTVKDNDIVLSDAPAQYVLRFRDIDDSDKPREKLVSSGPSALGVAELMAVILGVGTSKEDVLTMSRRIIKEYGDKAITHEKDPSRLAEALDIPLTKACQVVASFELGRRYFGNSGGRAQHIRNGKQAYEYLRDMGSLRKEQLRALYLDSRYRVIHDEIVSIGSLTANIVHPREVFQPAIEHGAVAVIIAHNHPSGSLEPSLADTRLTSQLVSAGTILGIDLIDHLIITNHGHISLLEDI